MATAGCQTLQPTETTGSLGAGRAPRARRRWRRSADAWGERYRANPKDAEAAINYAQALRGNGQRSQAVAVLEQASIQNPKHTGVLGAYGRALADVGNYKQALDVLNRAHTPDQPDWRILRCRGRCSTRWAATTTPSATMRPRCGSCPTSLRCCPISACPMRCPRTWCGQKSTLRRAAAQSRADRRVRQNLALVVGLQGRFSEAEGIARADLPSDEAAANVAYLRQMLAQQNGWKQPASRGQANGS